MDLLTIIIKSIITMKPLEIYMGDIRDYLIDLNIYDLEDLYYDYSIKRIIYKNKILDMTLEYEDLRLALSYKCIKFKFEEFKLAVRKIVRDATLIPQNNMDSITEILDEYLSDKKEIRIVEIIKNLFNGKLKDLTSRQLERKIANSLMELGWKRVRTNKYNKWIAPENKEGVHEEYMLEHNYNKDCGLVESVESSIV